MIKVTIRYDVPYYYFWRKQKQVATELPQSYNELSQSDLLDLCDILLNYRKNVSELEAVMLLCRMPYHVLKACKIDELIVLQNATKWIFEEMNYTKAIIRKIQYKGLTFYGPDDSCKSSDFLQFSAADDAFNAYSQTKDIKELDNLVAILYTHNGKTAAQTQKHRAKYLRDLPMSYKLAVYMFFSGTKKHMTQAFPDLFNTQQPSGVEQSKQPKYGWASVAFSIADSGIFGTVEQVYKTNVWNILAYLDNEHEKAIDQKIKLASTKRYV